MPFVNAKCTNCGGSLEVDNTKDAWICSYCGSPFIVEKAINNYNITNNNHIKSNVVNVYCGNNADFVIRGGVLEKYNGASTHVKIPNTVTHIKAAFSSCIGLISVEIPNSVKVIGNSAFSICTSLKSIVIPNSVKIIGDSAFCKCTSLKSIVIPGSVKIIGGSAFSECTSLSSVTISNGVMEIGSYAFHACTSLSSITIPNSVTNIRMNAFSCCSSLTSVEVPNINTLIETEAFTGCTNLKKSISQKKCRWCGGDFKLFSDICKKCGRKKDYFFERIDL